MHRFVVFLIWALAALPASAQVPAQPARALAPAASAARDVDPNALAQAALQILQAIDREQAGALWDGASGVTRRSIQRAQFVGQIATARKALGAPGSRIWTAVRREGVEQGGELPPGLYASIEFSSRFQARAATELVSLRLDEDGRWRFSGYVIR